MRLEEAISKIIKRYTDTHLEWQKEVMMKRDDGEAADVQGVMDVLTNQKSGWCFVEKSFPPVAEDSRSCSARLGKLQQKFSRQKPSHL